MSTLNLSILYAPELARGDRLQRAALFLSVSGEQVRTNGRLALALVIDRSYSMKLPMMRAAREAALKVVDEADPNVVLTLVAFSDKAQVLAEPNNCTEHHVRELRHAIKDLTAAGGTRMSLALDASVKRLRRYGNHVKRILFLTDGKNVESRQALERAVETCRDEGIEITAWGLGTQWDDNELRYLAEETGGSADLVLEAANISRAFSSSFQTMRATVMTDVVLRITLEGPASLRAVRQSYPYIRPLKTVADARLHTASVGSLGQGEQRVCLVELESPGDYEGVLAKVAASYRDAEGARQQVEGKVPLVVSRKEAAAPHPVVSHYLRQEELAETAARGRMALEQGDREMATRFLDQARRLSEETGNPYLTRVLTTLLKGDAGPAQQLGTQKTLALHSGRTVLHDRSLEGSSS